MDAKRRNSFFQGRGIASLLILPVLFVPAFAYAYADLDAAKLAYDKGDYVTAKKNWEILDKKGFPQAQCELGEMIMEGNDPDVEPDDQASLTRAIGYFNTAIEKEKYPPAYADLGRAYMNGQGVKQDNQKARDLFNQALALQYMHAWTDLGMLEASEGHFDIAEADLRKALDAGDPSAWRQIGNLHVMEKKYGEAEDDYKRAIIGGDVSGYNSLGKLYQFEGKYNLAIECFNRAISIGDFEVYIALGDAQIQAKQYDEAEASYQKAIDNGFPRGYVKIGTMYQYGLGRKVDRLATLSWYYKARKAGVLNMDRKIVGQEKHLNLDELVKAKRIEEQQNGKTSP